MNDILVKMVEEGLLDNQAAERVGALRAEGRPLDEALLAGSGLPEEELLRYLARELRVLYVDIEQCCPTKDFLSQFPARILLKHRLLPLEEHDGAVVVVTSKLFDIAAKNGPAYLIGSTEEMDLDRMLAFPSLAVTAGASTPDHSIDQVLAMLRGGGASLVVC